MGNEKKQTKGELERRIKSSIVLVPKDKNYTGVFFDDKGLKLEATDDFAIIKTSFHTHVFTSLTSQGVSRPYMYVKRFIEIAIDNDCMVKDEHGTITRSYAKLMSVLDAKEDKKEFNIAWYVDLWLNNIFHPLFAIGETETESFLVYETYLHNIARNRVILSEKTDDITNVQFVGQVCENEQKMIDGITERIVFKKKTDEDIKNEEISALQDVANEGFLKQSE